MTLTTAGPDSPLSSPASSAPHTPMPYDLVQTPDTTSQHFQDAMYFDDRESTSSAGSKRAREEDEEEAAKWTEEDVDTIQAALLHPFRPLSAPFPPGELPPPSVLDELTHQIVKYAYRPSPVKRGRSKQPPKPRPHEDGWTHSWDATRRKLFRVALTESQSAHGMDAEDRKLPRVERVQRPGLKRMDSMDFLDQAEEESNQDIGSSGRTARLSTSLQNTARATPLTFLSRSQSDDVTTTVSSASSFTSTLGASAPELPTIPAAITITPASPAAAPPLRRRGSSRASQPRASRPSLLQRGRSFTASDLEADPSIPDSPVAPPKQAKQQADKATIPPTAAAAMASLQVGPSLLDAPSSSRLTRSRSGLSVNAHPCRTAFLADRTPTTTERCKLALPFDTAPIRGPVRSQSAASGWSDSEDEQSGQVRHVKKVKPARAPRPIMTPVLQPALQADLLAGPSLRSPFEEKSSMTF